MTVQDAPDSPLTIPIPGANTNLTLAYPNTTIRAAQLNMSIRTTYFYHNRASNISLTLILRISKASPRMIM
jgi:hypothetical protein